MTPIKWEKKRGMFGTMVDYGDAWPKDANVVIVCSNEGTGLRPIHLLLPYQVYKEEHGAIRGLTLIPARSDEYIGGYREMTQADEMRERPEPIEAQTAERDCLKAEVKRLGNLYDGIQQEIAEIVYPAGYASQRTYNEIVGRVSTIKTERDGFQKQITTLKANCEMHNRTIDAVLKDRLQFLRELEELRAGVKSILDDMRNRRAGFWIDRLTALLAASEPKP